MDRSQDRIVTRFNYGKLLEATKVPIIAVYRGPADYPGKYVARVYDVDRPTNLVAVADEYEDILTAIPAGAMVRMERDPKDDPCIVETWV